jgi:dTDP-4-amino-4,6-dideoxygalactose transaminase
MADICAAFLVGQLECWDAVLSKRRRAFARYRERLAPLLARGVQLPVIPDDVTTNAHIFFLVATSPEERDRLIAFAKDRAVQLLFHYLPLHESPFGRRFAREPLPVTESVSRRLVRLPLHNNLSDDDADHVADTILAFYGVR